MTVTNVPRKVVGDAAHALCPGCAQPTQTVVRASCTTWHVECYKDPEKVAAYRARRRKDECHGID